MNNSKPTSLFDLAPKESRKILVVGESGTGKTVFAAGFPGPIWYGDFDRKISSAADFYADQPERLKAIEVHQFGPKNHLEFQKELRRLSKFSYEDFPYKTVVLDSLTLWSEALINEVVRMNPGKSDRPRIDDIIIPHLKDYGIGVATGKAFLNYFLALKAEYLIITAHVKVDKDEITHEVLRTPLIFGKELPKYLPVIFEEIYHCYVEKKAGKSSFLAQTRSDSRFKFCRSQISKMPDPIELSYDAISKYI